LTTTVMWADGASVRISLSEHSNMQHFPHHTSDQLATKKVKKVP